MILDCLLQTTFLKAVNKLSLTGKVKEEQVSKFMD